MRRLLFALALTVGVFSLGGVAQPALRVVAIADVHGDADAFAGILQAAGLIDAGRHWAGGSTRFVQLGDVLDRGPKVRDALDLLMRLEPEAEKAGGRVDALLGNHEVMNMLRDFRDVSAAGFAAFADDQSETRRQRAHDDYTKLVSARRKRLGKDAPQPVARDAWMTAHPPGFLEYTDAMGPKGVYGRWFRSHKVVLKVGDSIFMHAGIDPAIAPRTLDVIDTRVAREIRGWDEASDAATRWGVILPFFTIQETIDAIHQELVFRTHDEPGAETTREYVDRLQAVEAIGASWLIKENGPLWFRGFATWTEQHRPEVEVLLRKYGAARFAVGHTVQPTFRVTGRFDGRIVLLDTGMLSSFFKGRASALEVLNGQMTAVYPDSREPPKQ